jgi:Na+/H+ antiporter NhaD/arsenite permease-like protein
MVSGGYITIAIFIFLFVAINFLFPCNVIFPFDRRTTSIVGAVLCYASRRFFFPSNDMDLLRAINFDVMVLLSSIMVINHLIVHLKVTKDTIVYLQTVVQSNPVRGLWIISAAAFVISPFLTNDGVCLLFVEPILNAFEPTPLAVAMTAVDRHVPTEKKVMKPQKEDAVYFLLGLACSANIGSALTYTGNPQNMIVSSDAIGVLPPYKFLLFMFPASLFSWFISKWALFFVCL